MVSKSQMMNATTNSSYASTFSASAQRSRAAVPGEEAGVRRWSRLMVVCLGVLMAFVDASSVISALGDVRSDLHVTASTLVWITGVFGLAVVGFVTSTGTLANSAGRHRVFTAGASAFLIGSMLAVFADRATTLISAQAVMGVGGAALLSTGPAMVSATFSDRRMRTDAH
ncbi:MFS transporter [Streptomyces sp. NPDC002499]